MIKFNDVFYRLQQAFAFRFDLINQRQSKIIKKLSFVIDVNRLIIQTMSNNEKLFTQTQDYHFILEGLQM